LESLGDCLDASAEIEQLGRDFAKKALAREDWRSEGSAGIYCRCRTLPFVFNNLTVPNQSVEDHIRNIFFQLKEPTDRFGIGEADEGINQSDWYPPNAFHTFWTLRIIDQYPRQFGVVGEKISKELEFARRRNEMIMWARQVLGYQVSLHSAKSSMRDSDQLAWSLSILACFDPTCSSSLADQDLLRHALKCLFETQNDVGTWRVYSPLFHYKTAGNAYCYVFETFAVLLNIALRQEGEFLRVMLRPYLSNLERL